MPLNNIDIKAVFKTTVNERLALHPNQWAGEDRAQAVLRLVTSLKDSNGDAIKRKFIPGQRLTQKAMERFFRTDRYFPDGTPGFFDYIDDDEEEEDVGKPRKPPLPAVVSYF